MVKRMIILIVILLLTGCTDTPPPLSATQTVTATPSPTVTLAVTVTPPPLTPLASTLTPAPLPEGRELIFHESESRKLAGTAYGEGDTAIILANMSIGGEKQWSPFVTSVDKRKFTTITFNYRNIDDVGQDMDLILGWLRGEGFDRVVCIGASLGTRACSSIAQEPGIAGLVLIAGPVHHASVAGATYPKLFIAGALDRWAFDIEMGYEQAAEPKQLVLLKDNRAHGTDLFSSKDAEQFLTLLIDFVNGLENP